MANSWLRQLLTGFRWTELGPALLGAFVIFSIFCDLSLRQYFLLADLPTGSGRA
ncbi:MAG TPA: hypothetical protein VHV47_09625 [Opitutaceae bacterium]|jgi:hypothetical protein|nr:hypothetical protein [Opitutaceae bacterium]